MNAIHPTYQTFPHCDNSFAALPESFYTRLAPQGLRAPYLVACNPEVGELLGLSQAFMASPEFVEIFSGNRLLPGGAPLAAVYSGHQFGVWAGQLGDGRAHLLAGLSNAHGHWEIQLKGAGRTPYSRGADGRAVLRSSIREFLCSEAMAGLGVPTTRALCLVGSEQAVYREEVETAAIVTRVAPSFIRFGSFEHWAAQGKTRELGQLADYLIATLRPECAAEPQPRAALLADIARRTGELVAHWMAVGFMHGVMNTDNMSILGLTLDYGPFGFMEAFDPGHICNHSDHQGRYSYRMQPAVAHWNLHRLADAWAPLVGDRATALAIVDEHYAAAFERHFFALFRAKFGFAEAQDEDEDFFNAAFAFLEAQRPDFTLFFRTLSGLPAQPEAAADNALLSLCREPAAAVAWLRDWRARLARTPWPDAPRQAAMRAANPKYVLRNWLAELAIRRAKTGDFSEIARLLACLRHPYDEQPACAAYALPPPDWAGNLAVSCSS